MPVRRSTPDAFETQKNKKRLSLAEAAAKIQNYCAYQERSHKEVKAKLFEYGLFGNQVDELLSQLIIDGFLNEQRFAKAYAGGKFRMKKWGRLKIKNELEFLGLTKNCIATGLKEIDEQAYHSALTTLLQKKQVGLQAEPIFKQRDKLARYAIGKGYEPDLVWQVLKEILPD
ncbi:MAG: RecX family transcriptional regulator [Cyclobacteriaceae bacterium]|nr:RecX family transcriptional regulator [Cyclobacteriaceae bacterium]